MDLNFIFLALYVYILAKVLPGGANVSDAPKNIACLSNTKLVITCEAPEKQSIIGWNLENRNTSSPITLNNNTGSNGSTNYLMIKTKKGENLVIDSVRLRDAGVYYCAVINTTGFSNDLGGHIIVLDSDPTCHIDNVTVMEGGHIWLYCNITLDGLWRPAMEWKQLDHLGQEKINNDSIFPNVTESQQDTSMIVSLQILAKPHHNGISFVCSTYFDNKDMLVKHKVNNNTPDYNHTWKSPKINVLYGPTNVSIFPARDTLYPGDKLVCSAMGNPEPRYEWTGNDSKMGSQIDIVQSMVSDRPYVFICKAQNSVSESFANITFTVRKAARNCNETVTGLVAAVVILATLTITFFVCCLIALKRIKKGKKEKNISPNITRSRDLRTTAEYEEMQEAAQQSLGLPVYQNVSVLHIGYQELEL